ncbi:Zn-dependent exopeptidase [Ramaria rubella]|nr:Zn-dependent exopeptidase [Ramaria rubella]
MGLGTRLTNFCHVAISFGTPSTTFLTVAIYTAVFISSIVLYEVLPRAPAPSKQLGLDLTAALHDLQIIASGPHPYNSHANDAVRSHILSRVTKVAELNNNVHVEDDMQSNSTWYSGKGIYFEGNNILVKIDGKQPDVEAVLFSAHFDSVSTAPGATDDGMGVVTLLQLIDYFANNSPKRTVIFNINNGEEDGLHGAHTFLEHPWSSLPKLFLNLEGAGSGGRVLLFRTTSTSATRAFSNVAHPHGSVLSSDAFARGFIRSGTDFSVYQTEGMQGLDLAFYRRRSLYHTKDDSLPRLGGVDSLWNMMESALLSGIALTETTPVQTVEDPAVYFDVFGESLVVFSLRTFFIVNVVLLVVGPLLVALGIVLIHAQGKLHWSLRGWFRLPFALILGIGFPISLAALLAYVNPYIIYSSGYAVSITLIASAFIAVYGPLSFVSRWRPVPQQKSILLLETYVLWWVILVFDTVLVNQYKIGGFYIITFIHLASFLALVVTLVEHLRLPSTQHLHSHANTVRDEDQRGEEGEDNRTDETTPLIERPRNAAVNKIAAQEGEHYGFWFLEYLLLVPFPVILVTQTAILALGALPQSLADGNSALLVYLALAFLSFLLVFPVAPFAHKLHRYVAIVLLLLLLGTGVYNLVAFPFSTASPLTVFFSQTIDLDSGTNGVNLTGLAKYVDERIIPNLPSAWNQSVQCSDNARQRGLRTCQWAGLTPAVVPDTVSDWLSFNATLIAPGTALITIKGVNTRFCKVYFDHPVTSIRVDNSTGKVQNDYPFPPEGISELRLWSRTWDRTFNVTAVWQGQKTLTGKVACGWAESLEGRIPAFAEVIGFLPDWAEVRKDSDALVEATRKFSV